MTQDPGMGEGRSRPPEVGAERLRAGRIRRTAKRPLSERHHLIPVNALTLSNAPA